VTLADEQAFQATQLGGRNAHLFRSGRWCHRDGMSLCFGIVFIHGLMQSRDLQIDQSSIRTS
jgi:hypothetical protein